MFVVKASKTTVRIQHEKDITCLLANAYTIKGGI